MTLDPGPWHLLYFWSRIIISQNVLNIFFLFLARLSSKRSKQAFSSRFELGTGGNNFGKINLSKGGTGGYEQVDMNTCSR